MSDGLKLHFVSFASPIRRNFKQEPVYFTISIRPVAKFIVPDREDKVDSGIGLSHRPASICRLPGLYIVQQPYAGVNFIPPVRDYEFGN